jgi:hypothetical protein
MQQPRQATGVLHRAAAAEGAWPGGAPPSRGQGRLGAALAAEASRYLAAVELFRREGCRITWTSEGRA